MDSRFGLARRQSYDRNPLGADVLLFVVNISHRTLLLLRLCGVSIVYFTLKLTTWKRTQRLTIMAHLLCYC
jgi:hypothetical protein